MKARNVLISNLLSQIDNLATNQGVVGSNPAGRANSALNSMACEQLLQAIFLCCALEQDFGIEWHNVRADHLGFKGFDSSALPATAAATYQRSSAECVLKTPLTQTLRASGGCRANRAHFFLDDPEAAGRQRQVLGN
jgi:hypothetical protein